jgi:CBS domain-containing membrane protein
MTLRVKDLMSPDVETVYSDESMDLANTILTLGRIRHLPVVDREGRLCGILSQRDVLRAFAELFKKGLSENDQERIPITEIMTVDITTISPDAAALEAAEILWENKYGCLPVVEDGIVVGILTESDFVRSAIKQLSDPGM